MKTIDMTRRSLSAESLRGLNECEIIVRKEQLENLSLKVKIVDNQYYISHLELLFQDANLRNIKFIPPREEIKNGQMQEM